jgi:ribonucleoside-diphosphate reductase alpha chain
MWDATKKTWDECLASGMKYGYRNAQVTVLAPTGTIGFMMDCDTTGVEPDLALVKYKKMVGGGLIKIVNNVVPTALLKLGYSGQEASEIVNYIDQHGTIEGAPHLKAEHLAVFDCSLKPEKGKRSIHYMGHVRMMAAVQPFLSGAISKTVNMPAEATPEEISSVYTESWRLGLKAVAIYRDNSKRSQPLNTSDAKPKKAVEAVIPKPEAVKEVAKEVKATDERQAYRRKLSDERHAITHKFSVGQHEGYLTVGLYDNGQPGEIFITMAKEGSTVSGLMDSFATAVSFNLQYGVPLKFLVDKFAHVRFEPSGWTGNQQIPYAKSIMDYIFRWLGARFLGPEYANTEAGETPTLRATETDAQQSLPFSPSVADAPMCAECGSIMTRNGSCYKCGNCGGTSGCS